VAAIIAPDSVVGFLADLLEETTDRLARNGPWERQLTGGALEQLRFDLAFLETALQPVLTDVSRGNLTACATSARGSGKAERKDNYAAQLTRVMAQFKAQNVVLELPGQRV
jgi:hypothetical protein